ncbi:MAG: prealbumin-like fold domain-containing protein [Nitrososphaeria archaeon]|nr:prealbumin-like fold domain-containing protein [Nitrososphaeria archaeon]
MSQRNKIPLGPVKLCVDTKGFEDGRLVQFEIWMKKGGEEKIVDQVNGAVRSGKGEAIWTPQAREKRDTLKKDMTVEESGELEEYYFKARVGDLEVQSDTWIFLYPLEIYVTNENGEPLNGVEFEIEFSDGSKEKGTFTQGYAKFKGAPKGRFKLKVKGYKLKEEGS